MGFLQHRRKAFRSGGPDIANLISYYGMADASGNLTDSHGSNTLTVSGTPVYGATGIVGDCITFDGATDFFQGTLATTITDYPITLTGWLKSSDETTDVVVGLSKLDTNSYQVLSTDGTAQIRAGSRYRMTGGQENSITNGLTADDGSWHFGAAVMTSSTERQVYVDGVSYPKDVNSVSADSWDTVTIGALNYSGGDIAFWKGEIDEVSVWGTNLSEDDISWLYNSGSGRTYAQL